MESVILTRILAADDQIIAVKPAFLELVSFPGIPVVIFNRGSIDPRMHALEVLLPGCGIGARGLG